MESEFSDSDSAVPATKADIAVMRGEMRAFRVWVEGRLELMDQRFKAIQDLFDRRSTSFQEHIDQKFETVDQKFEAMRQETRALVSEGVGAIKDRMLTFFILHFLALIGAVLAVNRWS